MGTVPAHWRHCELDSLQNWTELQCIMVARVGQEVDVVPRKPFRFVDPLETGTEQDKTTLGIFGRFTWKTCRIYGLNTMLHYIYEVRAMLERGYFIVVYTIRVKTPEVARMVAKAQQRCSFFTMLSIRMVFEVSWHLCILISFAAFIECCQNTSSFSCASM